MEEAATESLGKCFSCPYKHGYLWLKAKGNNIFYHQLLTNWIWEKTFIKNNFYNGRPLTFYQITESWENMTQKREKPWSYLLPENIALQLKRNLKVSKIDQQIFWSEEFLHLMNNDCVNMWDHYRITVKNSLNQQSKLKAC